MDDNHLVPQPRESLEVTPVEVSYAARPGEGPPPGMGLLSMVLRRWRVVLLSVILLCGAGVPLIWLLMEPQYTAISAIEVAPVIRPIVFEEATDALPFYSKYVNTQAALIKSSRIIYPVLEDPQVSRLPYVKQMEDPVKELNEHLKATADRRSQLLVVSMTGESPEAITEIVNATVRVFMRIEGGAEATSEDAKLRTLERERDAAAERLRSLYEAVHQLGEEFGTTDLVEREKIMLSRVQGFQEELTKVQTARIALQAQAQFLTTTKPADSSSSALIRLRREYINADSVVSVLKQSVVQLEQQRVLASTKWRPQALEYQALKRSLDSLKTELDRAEKRSTAEFDDIIAKERVEKRAYIEEQVKTQLAQLIAREKQIREVLDKQNQDAISLGRKGLAVQKLQEEITFTNDLYQRVRERIQVLQVERQRPARVRVAYKAEMPREPSRDKRLKFTIVLVMGSMFFGCALAVFLGQLTMRVENPVEVEMRYGLRVLGTTPSYDDLDRDKVQASQFMDDCRSIWVNLMLASGKSKTRAVLVASPEVGDGKTSFSINLASSIAKGGKKVLLIDGDLRKADIGRYLDLGDTKGLGDVLTGQCALEEAIQPTSIATLFVLPGSATYDSDAEYLSSHKLKEMVDELKTKYDEVIIDTPAVLAMPDAKIWGSLVDGVVIVARSGKTGTKELMLAYSRMQQAGSKILGVVLTGVNAKHSYDRYYYHYRGGYAEKKFGRDQAKDKKVLLLNAEDEQDKPGTSEREDA